MPVCIAGMHRSGTSMIAGFLRKEGVYLGEENDFLPADGDNPEGFLEHFGFYALNEKLLQHLGGGWDMPDLPEGWVSRSDLEPFRQEALLLIERMRASAKGWAAWGWKDPRNSITIQFWRALIPGLRVVICTRNPLSVAASLRQRNNFSVAAADRLWLRYYGNLLAHTNEESRVITPYEKYFTDPEAELKRVLSKLGLPVDEGSITAARDVVNPNLHHHQSTPAQLAASDCSPEVIAMYARLSNDTGGDDAVAEESGEITYTETTQLDLARSRFHVETAQREEHIRKISDENAQLRTSLEQLTARLDLLTEEIATERNSREGQARKLTIVAERAVAVHGLMAHKSAQFASLQRKVEGTLKETKPMLPRLIRCSNSINSVYRIIKRIRKMGKLFTLQRELNDAMSESMGTLTHIAAVVASSGLEMDTGPAGLERYAAEKTAMDVPRLMELLRIRLS